MLVIFLLFSLFLPLLAASTVPIYGQCSPAADHLDPGSKLLLSECGDLGYCSPNGTCLPQACRRTEFFLSAQPNSPFGVPTLCPDGYYCPDEASGCMPLIPLGGQCQLNRDDECNQTNTSGITTVPANIAEDYAIKCLSGACTEASVTLGAKCILQNTTYSGYDSSRNWYYIDVVRDNCMEGQGHCVGDANTTTCFATKSLNENCLYDRQCASYNCVDSICCPPLGSPVILQEGIWITTGFLIATVILVAVFGLMQLDKVARARRRRELADFAQQKQISRDALSTLMNHAWPREKELS